MHPVKISIGNNNFREIRENNFYYVDKTLFLEELLSDAPQRTLLITRPRRFGKTMMMSTLFEFFDINKNSNNIFNGLSISKNFDICNKWMNKYPTVYITLRDLDCNSFSIFLDRFALYTRQFLNEHKYLLDSPRVSKIHKEDILNLIGDKYNIRKLEHLLVTICSALYEHYEKEVILLIDEYDSPLNFSYKNNYYKECVDFIKTFFYPLKDCTPIKLSILTGCLRIAKESIFTGMNHFVCCDISNNTYADKFGFTDNEIDKILNDTGFSEKKYKIKEWYDGYCFGNIDGIYCPWDIMQYIYALQKDPTAEPELFWKNTSGNDIIQLAIQKIENTSREKIEILLSDKSIQEKLETQLT